MWRIIIPPTARASIGFGAELAGTSVQHVTPEERKGHHHHCSGPELGDASETFASFFQPCIHILLVVTDGGHRGGGVDLQSFIEGSRDWVRIGPGLWPHGGCRGGDVN